MKILTRLRELLGLVDRPFRPRPADWNKTFADLDAEKRSLSGEEMHWAREYEREQLRGWARFPRNAEVFEATVEVEVSCLIHWRGPYMGGNRAALPASTRVRVSVPPQDQEPIGVYAEPLDRAELEERLVPEDDRLSSKYDGFSLFIRVDELNRSFRLVAVDPAGAQPHGQ